MGFRLSTIFTFLAFTVAVSHAASTPLPPQEYWNSFLPNTPMPKSFSELLKPDFIPEATDITWTYNQDAAADITLFYIYGSKPADFVSQILEDPTRRIFFSEKDVVTAGTTMKYRLGAAASPGATFLSRKLAGKIPFQSGNLPEILNKLALKPGSLEAGLIKDTIVHCEYPGMRGEEKYCATSLESMIDFATSELGTNVKVIMPEVRKEVADQLQNYTIIPGAERVPGDRMISCHKMVYKYAVYYCHATKNTTRAYTVPLEGADGTKAKAIAVCHVDTSEWNPNHYAFKELNIKPGTAPVCHFIRNKNLVGFRN